MRVYRAEPKVSHLFFAYDTLIFSKAMDEDSLAILDVLNRYGIASG